MLDSRMTIKQTDNGWILSYIGHDALERETVHNNWKSVLTELNEYFGWYNMDGELKKKPFGI